ncbi:MAG: pyridoxal phosphate-dependent aminotransferase [Flavobacteriales bacterium]|nr:pyridoxal phosphate-dependent aminotransferase [Flavobacteriales bacterium]
METVANKAESPFREVPYMGVIWVVAEAMKLGFYNGHPDWANLGQGQPEIGEMEGAPPRLNQINLEPGDHAYGHLGGNDALRSCVAAHYNRLYRQDKDVQYTADNVSLGMGGRLCLTRVFAALKNGRLGYQNPDYTAYEDMFNYHAHRLEPVLVPTFEEDGFGIPGDRIKDVLTTHQLDSFVLSNPCNPTGNYIRGREMQQYVNAFRETGTCFISDEFYSHFLYEYDKPGAGPASAAQYVEDVNEDPVIIIDGLTKSYRYPGWRIGWTVGPKRLIDTLNRAASAIDGGPSQPMQRAACEILEPSRADQETDALRKVFSRKKNIMLEKLTNMGIKFSPEPTGTFYVWANISELPTPINTALDFFTEALKRKVMTVPGYFFDIDPKKERKGNSPFNQWIRFSFGPPEENMVAGLERLEEMVCSFR